LDFDDSHWEHALEYNESIVGYRRPPENCMEPGTVISGNWDPITCPGNVDWGDADFI
jgi:hypothetical protein